MTPFRSSIATISISGTLAEKLSAIAAAGYQAVEIFENDLLSAPQSAAEIGRCAATWGWTWRCCNLSAITKA
jgi:4-hydroxyphenylpyruvate dioxygenase